eukprot:jgi/Orpsp1_1/1180577/evm.model.c7180000073960.2
MNIDITDITINTHVSANTRDDPATLDKTTSFSKISSSNNEINNNNNHDTIMKGINNIFDKSIEISKVKTEPFDKDYKDLNIEIKSLTFKNDENNRVKNEKNDIIYVKNNEKSENVKILI